MIGLRLSGGRQALRCNAYEQLSYTIHHRPPLTSWQCSFFIVSESNNKPNPSAGRCIFGVGSFANRGSGSNQTIHDRLLTVLGLPQVIVHNGQRTKIDLFKASHSRSWGRALLLAGVLLLVNIIGGALAVAYGAAAYRAVGGVR